MHYLQYTEVILLEKQINSSTIAYLLIYSASNITYLITLQETHFTSEIDVNYCQLPGYTMVNDFARLNKCG